MDEEDRLQLIENTLDNCFLPYLVDDIGTHLLDSKHFTSFLESLDRNLVQLFDLIQQNEHFFNDTENTTLNIRYKLVLLLCEQTSPDTLFQTQNKDLYRNLNFLLEKHFDKILSRDHRVEKSILDYYKKHLTSTNWKKAMGASFGFYKFLKIISREKSKKLNKDDLSFVLSVGLLLNEFYDPLYKEKSYEIFHIILENNPTDIKELNIHNVIYRRVILDVTKIDNEEAITNLWNCLYKCLLLMDIEEEFKWNEKDKFIQTLMKGITFARSTKIALILFQILTKICLSGSLNENEISHSLKEESIFELSGNVENIRRLCAEITANTSYKWAKKILSLLIAESNRLLMGNKEISYKLLCVFHVCYLVCIFPIQAKLILASSEDFYNKFVLLLMEALRLYKEDFEIVEAVKIFIQTFYIHFERGQVKSNLRGAIEELLQNQVFLIGTEK